MRRCQSHGGKTICCKYKVLGIVTSGGYDYRVGKTIAYRYLLVENPDYDEGYEIVPYKEVLLATYHRRLL